MCSCSHSKTLMPVLMATNAAQQLVEIAESSPGSIKMPKTLMLVKQLKKELNITKSMKDEHRRIGEYTTRYSVHQNHKNLLKWAIITLSLNHSTHNDVVVYVHKYIFICAEEMEGGPEAFRLSRSESALPRKTLGVYI